MIDPATEILLGMCFAIPFGLLVYLWLDCRDMRRRKRGAVSDEHPVWIIGSERRKADEPWKIPERIGTAIPRSNVTEPNKGPRWMAWVLGDDIDDEDDDQLWIKMDEWRRLMGRRKSDWEPKEDSDG